MNCPKCNGPLNPEYAFCPTCGTPVQRIPPNSSQQHPETISPSGKEQQPVSGSNAVSETSPAKGKRSVLIVIAVIVLLPFLAAGIYGSAKTSDWDRQNARYGYDSELDSPLFNGMYGFFAGIDYYIFHGHVVTDMGGYEPDIGDWIASDFKAKWLIGEDAASAIVAKRDNEIADRRLKKAFGH